MRSEIKDSSILVISHQERILNIADEIVLIKNGKIEKQGKKEYIYPSLKGGVDVSSVCRNGVDEEGDECL